MGIPHGGVLSVTLFLVAINGILRELGNGVDASLFADDLAIYITTSKTVTIKFRKRNEEPIEIMLRNKIIPSKENTQFLGMALDSRLNLEEHIIKLRAKAK